MAAYLIVFASAFTAAWTGMSGRLKSRRPGTKRLLVSFFEWFGDLVIFCGRLARAAFLPP
jgi:prolipoprotein diacylglyceryltransferase